MNPRHPNNHHPNYPNSSPHPNHFIHPNGYPSYPRSGQFANHPNYPPLIANVNGNFNPSYRGQFNGNPNNRVAVEMHQTDSDRARDPLLQRRPAPQGTAAVVYRGNGGVPQGRSNLPPEENTYFVLDADAVVDEPPAQMIDPLSLPRTQNRSNGGNPLMSNGRYLGTGDRAETLRLEPLVTANGQYVEDIVLDRLDLEHPNNRIMPNGVHHPQEHPMFLGNNSGYPMNGGIHRGSEENWPPPPTDLAMEEESSFTSTPQREGHQNNSLQIALRPSRDGQDMQSYAAANGNDFEIAASNNNNTNGTLP